MKIPASTRGRALIDIAAGASVSCLVHLFVVVYRCVERGTEQLEAHSICRQSSPVATTQRSGTLQSVFTQTAYRKSSYWCGHAQAGAFNVCSGSIRYRIST
jgi:hypothetical protein